MKKILKIELVENNGELDLKINNENFNYLEKLGMLKLIEQEYIKTYLDDIYESKKRRK